MYLIIKNKIFYNCSFLLLALAFIVPSTASAHVGYVLEPSEFMAHKGADITFFLESFSQARNVAALVICSILGLVAWYVLSKVKIVQKEINFIKNRTYSYYDLIPWILRLSLGIALVGAGTSGVLIVPTVPYTAFRLTEITVGFMLLAGFLTGPASIAAVVLYGVALAQNFYILGNLEFLSLAVSLIIAGDPWPGIDDLVGIPFLFKVKKLEAYIPLILRFGIGFAMIFLAWYEKILNPHLSEMVVYKYHFSSIVTPAFWVLGGGIIETLVGLLLLMGYKTRFASALAFLVLTMSFFYFQEAAFAHVTLFGALSILFITGSGVRSIDGVRKQP